MTDLLLMGTAVLLAAFVQGATGFGFAMISGPIIGLMQPLLLPVFLLIQMVPLNGFVAWRERHELDKVGTTWVSAGRFFGTFGGLWVLIVVTEQQLSLLIGISTVLAVIGTLLAPKFDPGRRSFVAAGLITGVTETATGIGGPPLAVVYQHHRPPMLRSSVAACFLVGEVISLVILAITGKITGDQIGTALILLPAVLVGAVGSRLVHHRLEGALMRRVVLGFALVSGLVVMVQAL